MVWEGECDGKKPGVLGTGELWSNRQAIKLYLQVVCLISTYFYNGEAYLPFPNHPLDTLMNQGKKKSWQLFFQEEGW